jgi:hypothetical protein
MRGKNGIRLLMLWKWIAYWYALTWRKVPGASGLPGPGAWDSRVAKEKDVPPVADRRARPLFSTV